MDLPSLAAEAKFDEAEAAPLSKIDVWEPAYKHAKTRWEEVTGLKLDFRTPDPEQELTNVRTVAKEWLAGALALFGLLSFSAIFFGGEALSGFKTQYLAPLVFLALTISAVACTVLCTFYGTRAAHGWPHDARTFLVKLYDKEGNGLDADDDPRRKTQKAIYDLKASTTFAAATVVLIAGALTTVVLDQVFASRDPEFLQVFSKDDKSIGCGTMSQGATADTFTISYLKENVVVPLTVSWADVGRLQAKVKCPS
jgi:hypothetical protein